MGLGEDMGMGIRYGDDGGIFFPRWRNWTDGGK